MAVTDGEDRVIAAAQQIVKALGSNENLAEDMLRILSTFDDRFSSMNPMVRSNRESTLASLPVPISDVEKTLDGVEETVIKLDAALSDSTRHSMIWGCERGGSGSFLQAVNAVQGMLSTLSVSLAYRSLFERARNAHQSAMARLEEEFKHMLVVHSQSIDPKSLLDSVSGPFTSNDRDDRPEVESCSPGRDEQGECIPVAESNSNANSDLELIPPKVVPDLNDIAKCMVAGGCGREICQAYASLRRTMLEQNLIKLGVEKLSVEVIQKMPWEMLENKIKRWIQCLKVSVRVIFSAEGKLSDKVFVGLGPWRETCFADLAKGHILQLLSFGEAIAISRQSPEKLFKILDMYEILGDLLPVINSIFASEACSNVRSEASDTLMRLGEAARGTFTEFENAIKRDTSKTPVFGGSIHPLTRYVMNYIRFLFEYSNTLKRLLGDRKRDAPILMGMDMSSKQDFVGEDENSVADHLSPLAAQVVWLTVLLECNLDGKSKLYKDPAQAYLFLMNNVHYMVKKVKHSELATLFGEDWIKKHTGQVRQYTTTYVRVAWKKVFACLKEEELNMNGSVSGSVSRVVVKERLKIFNSAFDETQKIQSTWVVPDPELRQELQNLVSEKLIPGYRSLLCRFQNYVESGKHCKKCKKYSLEDLEGYLLDMFVVTSESVRARRRSFSTV
eukprot:c27749_g2_i1 orf=739-2757(+)